jgi:hypothetical protein
MEEMDIIVQIQQPEIHAVHVKQENMQIKVVRVQPILLALTAIQMVLYIVQEDDTMLVI